MKYAPILWDVYRFTNYHGRVRSLRLEYLHSNHLQERRRRLCPPAHTVTRIIRHTLLNINVTLALPLGVRMVIA